MHRDEQNRLIQPFLGSLRRELEIEAVSQERIAQILEETKDHLWASLEAQPPSNEDEVREVVHGFGDARSMAREFGKTYRTADSKRVYLWPALSFGLFVIFMAFVPLGRVRVLGENQWLGSFVILALVMTLAVLGFRARRPLFGQFAALAATHVAVATLYSIAIGGVPVVYRGFGSHLVGGVIPPTQIDSTRVYLQNQIPPDEKLLDVLTKGVAFYQNPSEDHVPDFLMTGDRYLRAVQLEMILAGRETKAQEYPNAYSDLQRAAEDWHEHTRFEGKTQAEAAIAQTSAHLAEVRSALANMDGAQREPVWKRIPGFLEVWTKLALSLSLTAMFVTNLGWFAWFVASVSIRWARRLPLGA